MHDFVWIKNKDIKIEKEAIPSRFGNVTLEKNWIKLNRLNKKKSILTSVFKLKANWIGRNRLLRDIVEGRTLWCSFRSGRRRVLLLDEETEDRARWKNSKDLSAGTIFNMVHSSSIFPRTYLQICITSQKSFIEIGLLWNANKLSITDGQELKLHLFLISRGMKRKSRPHSLGSK